jgi:hypothetical protein
MFVSLHYQILANSEKEREKYNKIHGSHLFHRKGAPEEERKSVHCLPT